jgi:hypothetical protein
MDEEDSDISLDPGMMASMTITRQPTDVTSDTTSFDDEPITVQDGRVLCQRCQHLHRAIKRTGALQGPTDRKQLATRVSTLKFATMTDDCPFCMFWLSKLAQASSKKHLYMFRAGQMIHQTSAQSLNTEPEDEWPGFLLALSEKNSPQKPVLALIEDSGDSGLIGVLPQSIQDKSESYKSPHLVTENITDFSFMRQWLQSNPAQNVEVERSPVPLYMIDCQTRMVEMVFVPQRDKLQPVSGFVALSYVWGPDATDDFDPRNPDNSVPFPLPDKCAGVIEDALLVTKELGYRWLWVDRHCVEIENAQIRHDQIARMDFVYAAAAVTIIAAIDRPREGLPGIRRPRSMMQNSIVLDDHFYFDTMESSRHALKYSSWNTRGWTYQERVLSSRRLIFTSLQTYFECESKEGYSLSESTTFLRFPLIYRKPFEREWLWHQKLLSVQEDSSCLTHYNLNGSSYISKHVHQLKPMALRAFEHHVHEYTKRHLTYDTDSLNAILGILNWFDTADDNLVFKVRNSWGVPWGHSHWFRTSSGTDTGRHCSVNFAYGLCWTHGDTNSYDRPRRRPMLPSWSWAGWQGEVTWLPNSVAGGDFESDARIDDDPRYAADILPSDSSSYALGTSLPKTVAILRARVIPLRFVFSKGFDLAIMGRTAKQAKPFASGYYLSPVLARWMFHSFLHLDRFESQDGEFLKRLVHEEWDGVRLGRSINMQLVYFLVVGKVNRLDDHVERIGIIQVPENWYWKQKPQEKDIYLT